MRTHAPLSPTEADMSTTSSAPRSEPYAWLCGSAMRVASDICLGVIALITGTVAIWGAYTLGVGSTARLGPGNYPLVIGCLLLAFGIAALLRAVFLRKVEHARWGLIGIAVIAAVIVAVQLAVRLW